MNILDEFDVSKFKLGSLCKRNHNYKNTGQSLRRIRGVCLECEKDKYQESYERKTNQCDICNEHTSKGAIRPIGGQSSEEKYFCQNCIKAITHKKCSQCQTIKPLTDFHKGNGKGYIDGHRAYCKECHSKKYEGYRSPAKVQRQQEYKRKRDESIAKLQLATHKECTKCKQLLPKEKFNPRKNYSLDGLNQQCRDCCNARRERLRRSNGVKPRKPEYPKLQILESFIGKIDGADELSLSGIYYLGGVCSKGHDWENTGYSLRFKTNNHCLACNYDDFQKNNKKYRDANRYMRWLENPRISPNVAELVAKSEQWARTYRKELFMSPEEREEYNRKNREAYKKRYQENREKEKIRAKVYKHANPEKVAMWGDNRRQRVAQQSDGSVTASHIKEILNKTKKCPYCSTNLKPSTATIDHLIPISLGGSHAKYNVVPCCYDCNVRKAAKPFPTWLNELDDKHRESARNLYIKMYGAPPEQQTLPLVFM